MTLKQGLLQKAEEPVPGPAVIDGLADTLDAGGAGSEGPGG